jgi:hypothetical protein
MKKSFSLITTTINKPVLIEDYVKDAIAYKHNLQEVIVVGDQKTPEEVASFCKKIEKKYSILCTYLSLKDQISFLKKYKSLNNFIPWNCIQRRNLGLLKFYENFSDVAVLIDDDNFILNKNYFSHHSHLGNYTKIRVVNSKTGWWNVCEMLEDTKKINFYHRGHPLSKRWLAEEKNKTVNFLNGRAVANAGLWFDDPDVDAITRLFYPIEVKKKSKLFYDKTASSLNNFSPFNSQNTSLLRELIPAYFLFPYFGRYDDIWASYIIRRIANTKKDYITYGEPIVVQKRNPHDYFKDFEDEKFGLKNNDCFIDILKNVDLSKNFTYAKSYEEIFKFYNKFSNDFLKKHSLPLKSYDKLIEGMNRWIGCF